MIKGEMLNETIKTYCKYRDSWMLWQTAIETNLVVDKDLADRLANESYNKANAIEELGKTLFPNVDFYGLWLDTIE